MSHIVTRFALVASLIFGCVSVSGQNSEISRPRNSPLPEYVQEFFLSDAVRSQEKGELQITIAVDSRRSMGTNLLMKSQFGLTDRLQLSAEVPYGKNYEDIRSES